MNEFSFIEYLKRKIPRSKQVPVGIGDDAAVMNVAQGKRLVVSTDAIVENVDFPSLRPRCCLATARREGSHLRDRHAPAELAMAGEVLSPEKIGRKALAINLSDMAAMGALPTAFMISVGKPARVPASWLKRFYKGLLALAEQYNVVCIGGDFSKSREFFASVTIFGAASPHQIIKRSGAKSGDWIAVTGSLGGSRLRKHFDFTPLVREGIFLAKKNSASSMIDISDGLCQDLGHILKASKVGAVLDLDKIPVSRDAKRIARSVILSLMLSCESKNQAKNLKPGSFAFREAQDDEALKRALSDGEDFELLFTVSPRKKMALEKTWKKQFPKVPLTWIGKVERKKPLIRWVRNGKAVPAPTLRAKGFTHF